MRPLFAVLTLVAVLLVLWGAAAEKITDPGRAAQSPTVSVSPEDFNGLKVSTPQAEVYEVLGRPSSSRVITGLATNKSETISTWVTSGVVYSATFRDGVLVEMGSTAPEN